MLDSNTEVGVFEMGMSSKGEIARLGAIAGPDIGVITNISPVHTEFFESVKDVALAKAELLALLGENGLAVLNADDDWFSLLTSIGKSRVLTFGMANAADVVSTAVHQYTEGLAFDVTASGQQCRCRLNAYGRHNAYNALAAIATALELGIELETACSALAGASLPEMRFQFDDVGGIMLINDAYNANPISTIAALDALDQLGTEGRLVAVLGDMLELGWYSSEGHREVGQRVARSKIDVLLTVGDLASEIAVEAAAEGFAGEVERVTSAPEAASLLREFLKAGDTLFIKGSRAVRLEQIIELIKKDKLTERP
jgi:UDP-N-acetylmuramoyl-tripeptide--D-alanyl-D-alanine ligase